MAEEAASRAIEEETDAVPRERKQKDDLVWKFFTFPEGFKKVNAPKVTCTICNRVLSRGDPTKKYSFGIFTMKRHMENLHPSAYARECLREENLHPPPAVASTSSAPIEAPECIPNIQQKFNDVHIKCNKCCGLICYGESSIKLINTKIDAHICTKF